MKLVPLWLSVNFRVKAGIFLLACVLWFLVITEQLVEWSFDIPIVIVGNVPDRVLAAPIPSTALVRFQATGKQLIKLQFFNRPILQVHINPAIDRQVVRPNPEMVLISGGIPAAVLEVVSPESLDVHLADRLARQIPVASRLNIGTAPGYEVVGGVNFEPPRVRVEGPRQVVKGLDSIPTEPYQLSNLKRYTTLILNLDLPDTFGLAFAVTQVKALIKVDRLGERTISGVAVKLKFPPENRNIVLEPSIVDVHLSGPVSILADIEPDDLSAWVDFRQFHPLQSNRMPVEVESDVRVRILRTVPKDVRLIIHRP